VQDKNGSLESIGYRLKKRSESKQIFKKITMDDSELLANLPILGSTVAVRVVNDEPGYMVGFIGQTTSALQWLNDVMVTAVTVGFDSNDEPMHVLHRHVPTNSVQEAIVDAAKLALTLRQQEESADFARDSIARMNWYSAKLNFGDWIGPYLVHAITGRQPIQANRPGTRQRILFSVGSIIGRINQDNVDVWGSGLMRPLTTKEIQARKHLKGIKIHAVRGKLSRRELQESLGWKVPEVYGDPALLLPDVLKPEQLPHNEIAVVPHYVHLPKINRESISGRIVDVRSDVRSVVEELAGAKAVVSSSLHGLIIAQAYGVPWVWLDVTDHKLGGGDFKFEDFFSCLDREKVSRVQIDKDELRTLDLAKLAESASLPVLHIDLSLLRDALPIQQGREDKLAYRENSGHSFGPLRLTSRVVRRVETQLA
jgi:hypothetical protein